MSHHRSLQSWMSDPRSLQRWLSHHRSLQRWMSYHRSLQSWMSHHKSHQRWMSHPRSLQSWISYHKSHERWMSHPRSLQSWMSHPRSLQNWMSHHRSLQSWMSCHRSLQSWMSHPRSLQSGCHTPGVFKGDVTPQESSKLDVKHCHMPPWASQSQSVFTFLYLADLICEYDGMSSVTVISSGNPAMRGQSVSDSGSEKIVKFAWIFFYGHLCLLQRNMKI